LSAADLTTMAPIRATLDAIPRPTERCIAQYSDAQTLVDYAMSWADWADDVTWARTVLSAWGVSAGDFVVVVSTGHEAALYGPIIDALNRLGVTVCPLEPAEFEIGRAQMFFHRFPISAVVGLDATLGPALVRNGLFGSECRFVLARPDAVGLTTELGIPHGVVTALGPALAMTCPGNGLIHVNSTAWELLDSPASSAQLGSLPARHHSLNALDVSGSLTLEARSTCCSLGPALGRAIVPS
jgi:hypothetical protein